MVELLLLSRNCPFLTCRLEPGTVTSEIILLRVEFLPVVFFIKALGAQRKEGLS